MNLNFRSPEEVTEDALRPADYGHTREDEDGTLHVLTTDREPWQITPPGDDPDSQESHRRAAWCVAMMRRIRREAEVATQPYTEAAEALEKQAAVYRSVAESIMRGAEYEAEPFKVRLMGWMRTLRTDKRKSVRLPGGRVKSWPKREGYRIVDEATVVTWLEKRGLTEAIKRSVSKSALNDYVAFNRGEVFDTLAGEPVPGVEYEPEEIRYDVVLED